MKEKVVLAYSGGLDTTAIIPWLKETFDYEVICCCIDCGQGNELVGLDERAKLSGASKLYIENIMMDAVKNGGNRQELHEKIRTLSMQAGKTVKEEGKDNNLLELIAADPEFNLTLEALQSTMDPAKYVGRAPIQVDKFIANVVKPILDANKEELGVKAEINV